MQSEKLFIPKRIKVGYNERSDTYTKRLAYIIYYDNKGVLRKETSWLGWIDKGHDGREYKLNEKGEYLRDEKGHVIPWINPEKVRAPLPTHEFDNVPTEGFVLNKKAGGDSSGWNHRQTYCRVYDPRGFEFEITIPNLLFILQESNSYKGKGLEGEFVYSWDGKDLVLLPVSCEDYKMSMGFTKLQSESVKSKDLIVGAVYQTKQKVELIYLGRFEHYRYDYPKGIDKYSGRRINKKEIFITKKYFFAPVDKKNSWKTFEMYSDLKPLATLVSDIPVDNYAEIMELFSKEKYLSAPKHLKIEEKKIDFEALSAVYNLYKEVSPFEYDEYILSSEQKGNWVNGVYENKRIGYVLKKYSNIKIDEDFKNITKTNYQYDDNNKYIHSNYISAYQEKYLTKEEVIEMNFKEVNVVLENELEIKLNNII